MPPGPDAEAMGSDGIEFPLSCGEEEGSAGYFLPGMRKKPDGSTVAGPLPFVPAGGFGNAAGGGVGLAADFRGAGVCRCGNGPVALPSVMPRPD